MILLNIIDKRIWVGSPSRMPKYISKQIDRWIETYYDPEEHGWTDVTLTLKSRESVDSDLLLEIGCSCDFREAVIVPKALEEKVIAACTLEKLKQS